MDQGLPIANFRDSIAKSIRSNEVTIITAETGAGKSTQVPQIILELGLSCIVTQPRRLAARTLAERVAEVSGTQLGNLVGFRTAHERKDSRQTRCLFCTDGLALVRELMARNRVDVLVIDEVHEWNLNVETLIAWVRTQQLLGVTYKIVIMSATIDTARISAFFEGAPIISVPGRLFPIEERDPGPSMLTDTIELLRAGHNVLVFQPGKSAIRDFIADLVSSGVSAEILPLHGELESAEQARCFQHYRRPKCVVSTNVAQTSVTIPDIDAVVDSEMERRTETVRGVEGLYERPISMTDREQRKGRAGRTKPGVYIGHCPEADYNRPHYATPEILRCRLDQTVLRLARAGFDAEELRFFHQPKLAAIHEAKETLKSLGCLTEEGQVTAIGEKVANLPVAVQYGRMIVEAQAFNIVGDIITIAAILEQGEVIQRGNFEALSRLAPNEDQSDVLAHYAAYEAARAMASDNQRRQAGINVKNFHKIREMRKLLFDAVRREKGWINSGGSREDILRAICAGMVNHLYQFQDGAYVGPNDLGRLMAKESVLFGEQPEWVVGIPFDLEFTHARSGQKMTRQLIRMATAINPAMLIDVAPQLVERQANFSRTVLCYDADRDEVMGEEELAFNGHVIVTRPIKAPTESRATAGVFARWFTLRMLWSSLGVGAFPQPLRPVARANSEVAREIEQASYGSLSSWYLENGHRLPFRRLEDAEAWFLERLAGATSLAEVTEPERFYLIDPKTETTTSSQEDSGTCETTPVLAVDVSKLDLSGLFNGAAKVKA